MRSASRQGTPLADVDDAFFFPLVRNFTNSTHNRKRKRGIVVLYLWYTKRVPTLLGGGSFGSPETIGTANHPTFRNHLLCFASLSRQGPETIRTPSLFFGNARLTPSLSILIRMAVSAFSAKPFVSPASRRRTTSPRGLVAPLGLNTCKPVASFREEALVNCAV